MTSVIETTVVEPATEEAVRALVRRCSPASLGRRFGAPAPLGPEAVLDRYGRYLLAGPPAGTATIARAPEGPVGLLNLVVVEDGLVEAGLLVCDPWHRRRVATGLVAAELARPRWAGWTVRVAVAPDNAPARAMLRHQRWGRCALVRADRALCDYDITRRPA